LASFGGSAGAAGILDSMVSSVAHFVLTHARKSKSSDVLFGMSDDFFAKKQI
jgi:hypothetical protein